MAQTRTRRGLGSGGCFAPAGGVGRIREGETRKAGFWGRCFGAGKARMCPNNEIIMDQSERLSRDTCLTCPPKGKRIELASGEIGVSGGAPKGDV